MALAVPAGGRRAAGNYLFVLIMIALTLAAVVVTVLHPIAWSRRGDPASRSAAPAALGILVVLVGDRRWAGAGQRHRARPGRSHARSSSRSVARRSGRGVVRLLLRLAGDSGFGPLAPAAGARRPASRLPTRLAARRDGWLRPGPGSACPVVWLAVCLVVHPARRVRHLVHAVGVSSGNQLIDALAAGPHGPDAARPDRGRCTTTTTTCARPHAGVLAVVGLAARPQAGLVLPGQLRRRTRRPSIYDAGNLVALVAGDPGDGVRRLAGVHSAGAWPWRWSCIAFAVPVAAVGAHRPGDVPVPLLHERCRS